MAAVLARELWVCVGAVSLRSYWRRLDVDFVTPTHFRTHVPPRTTLPHRTVPSPAIVARNTGVPILPCFRAGKGAGGET